MHSQHTQVVGQQGEDAELDPPGAGRIELLISCAIVAPTIGHGDVGKAIKYKGRLPVFVSDVLLKTQKG